MGYISSIVPAELLEGLSAKPLDEQEKTYKRFAETCNNAAKVLRGQWNRGAPLTTLFYVVLSA
jgi:hypothetical protein